MGGSHNQVRFPLWASAPAHAAVRGVAGSGGEPRTTPHPRGDLSIQDSKSALVIRAELSEGEGDEGPAVYNVSLEGEARNAAMRLRMVLAGFTRYGEMEQVGESGVAFECGLPHDALMRVLMPIFPQHLQRRDHDGRRSTPRADDDGNSGLLADVDGNEGLA